MSSSPWYRKIEKIRKDWLGKTVNQKTLIGYIKNDYLGSYTSRQIKNLTWYFRTK